METLESSGPTTKWPEHFNQGEVEENDLKYNLM